MQELLCFAGQNVSRKIDGEAFPAGGFRTAPAMFRSWSDRPRSGTASSGFIFTTRTFKIWRKSRTKASLSHLPLRCWGTKASFSHLPSSSTFRFWGMSRTKASFSHLPLWDFEGCLAQKLRFHIWNFHFLRDVSHESFVFASSTFRCWGLSRTKAAFFTFSTFTFLRGLARKLRFTSSNFRFWGTSHKSFVFTSSTLRFWEVPRTKEGFHIFHFHCFREVMGSLPRHGFWKVSGCKNCVFCRTAGQNVSRKIDGEAFPAGGFRTVPARFRSWSDRPRSGTASSGFDFTTRTFKIWRKSRTKASFSHLPLRCWGTKASWKLGRRLIRRPVRGCRF